ncbi:GNAT family N-acetyltransferase [Roseibium sp.]|uniref:GNAT family N-acetyltransferase n=1 Tax=Roseibium sp. TaxID=1936156 RepID=UPI003A985C01
MPALFISNAILLLLPPNVLYRLMMETAFIELRDAKAPDCEDLAAIHSAAWLGAYRGLLNGVELDRLIARRPPQWWRQALARGVRIKVLEVSGQTVGYGTFGTCRIPNLSYEGEIYELYLLPEHQGLGFGRTLFEDIRRDLSAAGLNGLAVQVLSVNEPARAFYRATGGKLTANSSYLIKGQRYELSIYGWPEHLRND